MTSSITIQTVQNHHKAETTLTTPHMASLCKLL